LLFILSRDIPQHQRFLIVSFYNFEKFFTASGLDYLQVFDVDGEKLWFTPLEVGFLAGQTP